TRPNTPTAGIALQNGRIIYASVDDIRFVPTVGAVTDPSARTIAKASSTVTALHAVSNGVYWGERSGAVRLKVGSTITTLQSITNFMPTSISTSGLTAGAVEAWTDCTSQSCRVHGVERFPSSHGVTFPIGANALGLSVKPSREVFWGDANGVHRRIF